jgi:hypothetical protein
MLLSLSYYKFAYHYFLHLQTTLCTHTCHIPCILLLCSVAQKMKSSLMKISFRCAGPRSSACGMVLYSTAYTSWPCNKFYIRLDVINT